MKKSIKGTISRQYRARQTPTTRTTDEYRTRTYAPKPLAPRAISAVNISNASSSASKSSVSKSSRTKGNVTKISVGRVSAKKSSSTKSTATKSVRNVRNIRVNDVATHRNGERNNVTYYGTQGNAALKPVVLPETRTYSPPNRQIIAVPKKKPSLVPMVLTCIGLLFASSMLSLYFSAVQIPNAAYKMSELEHQSTVLTTEIEALNEAVQRKNNDLEAKASELGMKKAEHSTVIQIK
ncbi:MAG: hypothetical protein LBL41_00660 [Bifidobacteriaceae bacterium]|jgi:hypothetical protein|nr:hypothetical protein [Bifidobacteriaceae bacterium]